MRPRTNISKITLLILVLVSSGCLSVTVTHDIKMDGTSDIDIKAEGSELTLKSFENELNSSALELENAEIQKRENRHVYSYVNVPANLDQTDNLEELDVDVAYSRNPGLLRDSFRLEIDSRGNNGINGNSIFTYFLSEEPEIKYRLKYFGSLQDTNGELSSVDGENYVVFDLSEEEHYFVEFRALKPRLIYARFGNDEPCGNPMFDEDYSQKC